MFGGPVERRVAGRSQCGCGPVRPRHVRRRPRPACVRALFEVPPPDGPAPFSLLTYADVKRHAEQIAIVTKSRYMPPWKPEPGYGEFADSRRLSDDQIAVILRWVAEGMSEGDPATVQPAPAFSSAWHLGEPDLVLTMTRPYTVAAAGDDVYRHFVIPIPVDRRFVKAWELRAGNSRVVHHATMEIDQTGASRHLDEHDPEPGYEGLIAHTAMAPDGYFLDWAPGHTPYVAPDGMAFPVEKNSDLILMLHLRPTGMQEMVQVNVGLYFTQTPPSRVTLVVSAVFLVLTQVVSMPKAPVRLVAQSASVAEVTFSKDVAPIFQKSCQGCHHPDSIAPMSLMTYEEARPWARSIRRKVVAREMPPWHIEKNIGIQKFKDDISLSDAEIATIAAWADGGAARGNPADSRPRYRCPGPMSGKSGSRT
jgi:hypothetical protein